jgi:hypothetical protein
MSPFLDGLLVLQRDAATVLAAVAMMILGGALMTSMILRQAQASYDADDLLSLAAGAWIVPALLASGLALLFRAGGVGAPAAWILVVAGAAVAICFSWSAGAWRRIAWPDAWPSAAALAIMFLGLALVRLAFLKDLALPLYFDSATHYGLIQQLLQEFPRAPSSERLFLPAPGYYHLGYHVLLAALTRLARADIARMMLVSGQLVLAAAPLPIYVLVHRATRSRLAGMLAVVIAALGWYMPAHSINWGKYPALFSMLPMLSALSLALLATQAKVDPECKRALRVLALLAAGAALMIHSRAIIILLLGIGAWLLAGRWQALRPGNRTASLAFVLLAVAGLGAYAARDPVLAQVLDPYLRAGSWLTALIGLLCVPAMHSYPRISLAAMLSIVGLLSSLVMPAPDLLAGSLLDRPLVEMLLPVPLSVLGAAGFAGLLALPFPRWNHAGQAAGALLALAVAAHAAINYSPYPSACCAVAGADDLVALDWLRRNIPEAATVAIASSPLRLAPQDNPVMEAPADAGAWIQPLTGADVTPLPYTSDFGDSRLRGVVCNRQVDYDYVGISTRSFNTASLQGHPEWYQARLLLPAAAIYEVTPCGT